MDFLYSQSPDVNPVETRVRDSKRSVYMCKLKNIFCLNIRTVQNPTNLSHCRNRLCDVILHR